MNKKRMWLLAISIATMITANGLVMAATPDKQDNVNAKWHHADKSGMKGFHGENKALLAFLKIDAQTFEGKIKEGKTLAEIAKEQGIAEQDLKEFMIEQMTKRIDAAVKAGKLTEDKATQAKADIEKRADAMINGKGPMPGHGMRRAPFDQAKLLEFLKMDKDSFRTEMKAGKSLLVIAKEHDISEQELTAFLTQQMTERINEGVKAGRIQNAQAEQMKANMAKHIANMINHAGSMHGHGPMGHIPYNDPKLLELLNMDEASLKAELESGKPLAAVADEHGVSKQSLKEWKHEAMRQRLDQAVKEGRISAEKAEQIKTNMQKHEIPQNNQSND